MFITFEGCEGCGKSTHAALLKKFLESKGQAVVLTREPGGTMLGEKLRAILLQDNTQHDPLAELCLFAADRAEHVGQVIKPALASGKTVICDRYTDSTLAYQIGGRELPEDLVRYLVMVSSQGIVPDLTFLLDVTPQVGLKRAARKQAADRFEKETLLFHARVRKKFLEIADNNSKRVKVLTAENQTIEETAKEICINVEAILAKRGL